MTTSSLDQLTIGWSKFDESTLARKCINLQAQISLFDMKSCMFSAVDKNVAVLWQCCRRNFNIQNLN